MHLHLIVSFLVGVILDLLQLKFSGNGNQGGVSSHDSSTSPFNTHPVMILLGALWLLLYSCVALAASSTATATSSSSPTSDSPSNREVVASDLSAATIFPSASSPAPAATSSSPEQATSSNPSLSAPGGAAVVIVIPTSRPTVAVSTTSSSWISMILGKISYPASKLIAKIKCPPEQLMLTFASMAISTFGCLLFPTSAQYYVLSTSYALIIGFNAFFLCLLPRQGNISPPRDPIV